MENREIKFRCYETKRNIIGKVIMFFTGDNAYGVQYLDLDKNINLNTTASNEGIILMQYIGVKDTSGVEMYEGDICEIKYKNNMPSVKGIIEWNNSHAEFSVKTKEGLPYSPSFQGSMSEGIFVIGNIYQNKELI